MLSAFLSQHVNSLFILPPSLPHYVHELLQVTLSSSVLQRAPGFTPYPLSVCFPLDESECISIASEQEKVKYLSRLVFHSSINVQVNLAALIETIVSRTCSPELRAQISNVDEIYEGVVNILRSPISYPRTLKIGIKALFTLCLLKQTQHKAIAAGAPDILIDQLSDLEKCNAKRALVTIELLYKIPEGLEAFARHVLMVPQLMKTILKISDRATEHAAEALLALCSESEESRSLAVAARVLTPLLLVVQSDCTEWAKWKAQMLLKLLRDSWPPDCVGNYDDFACNKLVVPF